MKKTDIELFCCVSCQSDLVLENEHMDGDLIIEGVLKCTSCPEWYPIIGEVALFFTAKRMPLYLSAWEKERLEALKVAELVLQADSGQVQGLEKKQLAVSQNWEYQWDGIYPFDKKELESKEHIGQDCFWEFVKLKPEQVEGKTVLIACGGRGREAYHVVRANPERVIVNEIGSEIHSALKLMPEYRSKLVLARGDLCQNAFRDEIADFSICDHALQHVPDHKLGYNQLSRVTKKGGLVSICVYSYENNFIMTHIVDPSKAILHRFPLGVQRYLSFPPALIVFLLIHLLYVPMSKISQPILKCLPIWKHMLFWKHNSLETVWMSCFDLVHAPVSYHFRKEETEALANTNGLEITCLENTYSTLWSMVAKK